MLHFQLAGVIEFGPGPGFVSTSCRSNVRNQHASDLCENFVKDIRCIVNKQGIDIGECSPCPCKQHFDTCKVRTGSQGLGYKSTRVATTVKHDRVKESCIVVCFKYKLQFITMCRLVGLLSV